MKASQMLCCWRPELVDTLEKVPQEERPFGLFHLFMTPEGASKMHNDRGDLIALLVLLSKDPSSSGGALEIGGTSYAVDWQIGEAILLDSAQLYHGSRDYCGNLGQRLVGIFIIHNAFLKLNKAK